MRKAAGDCTDPIQRTWNHVNVMLNGAPHPMIFTGLVACEIIEAILRGEEDDDVKATILSRLLLMLKHAEGN